MIADDKPIIIILQYFCNKKLCLNNLMVQKVKYEGFELGLAQW